MLSRATTVVANVWFSLTENAAVAPPPLEVMIVPSFTLPTVMVIAWIAETDPFESVARTSRL